MMMYPLVIEPDDNGTLLVTCPMLPEVTTFGSDHIDALHRGTEAVEEALAARMAAWGDVPVPDGDDLGSAFAENRAVSISLPADMKLTLYLACREAGVSRADLVRRLGWKREQVDRLFRMDHASRADQIDAAVKAIGQHMTVVSVPVASEAAMIKRLAGSGLSFRKPLRGRFVAKKAVARSKRRRRKA
jgi:antitoxin HicB